MAVVNEYTNGVSNEFCMVNMDDTKLDHNKNEVENKSLIQQFYDGKNVFITGGTGFLGKILIEKLLRCCTGVENLYLLVRQKKGKDIYTRLDEIFEDPVFDRLKKEVPKFRHKIVAISGDCNAAGLGLSLNDLQTLTEKINIIFHSAATVKFDEHLKTALITNVQAPLHLLRLARDMKGLDVLIHVSTAYSNCPYPRIEEKFYPCEVKTDELFTKIEKLTDEEIDQLLPSILGRWPNTYTLTKALAEKELRENVGKVPLGVFRPAIVTSTAKEPLQSWIDNMYGPTGVAVGGVTGVLRTMQCDGGVTADIVPVDLVVNCLLAAARAVHLRYKDSTPEYPPVFNYVSSCENRLTWGDFMKYNIARIQDYPLNSAVWYPTISKHSLQTSAIMNQLCMFILHIIPAAIFDALSICVGKKPKMLKLYRKIHKFSAVIAYFCTREFSFCNKETQKLWEQTSEADRKIFPFSMKDISWEEYLSTYLYGIRKYIFKETDETLPKARIKAKRLYYLHQIVKTLFICFVCYIMWSVVLLV